MMLLKRPLFIAVLASLSACPVFATENITVIGTTITTGTPSTSDGYTFENGVQAATSFSTATGNYIVASLANNVFVRRNGTTANNSSVWYASSGTGTNLTGIDQTAYDRMLLAKSPARLGVHRVDRRLCLGQRRSALARHEHRPT